jgi:hypothetical protein
MTPDTTELLSRYLDDDLDQDARRELETRLAADQTLKEELDALRRIRDAIRELASSEQAPSALDRLLGHLERSSPPAPRLRPALRVAAIAATLVIGTAVVLRLSQHSQPQIPRPAGSTQQAKAKDEAHAEPSRASTAQSRPEGPLQEVDRLASRAPSPPAARRMGGAEGARGEAAQPSARPVPRPQAAAEGEHARAPRVSRRQEVSVKEQESVNKAGPTLPPRVRAEPVSGQPGAGRPAQTSEEKGFVRLGVTTGSTAGRQAASSVEIGGRAFALAVRLPADLASGRYPLHMTVQDDGRIAAARPALEDKNVPSERHRATALDRACALLTGTRLAGVTAGEHEATLIVPAHSSPR